MKNSIISLCLFLFAFHGLAQNEKKFASRIEYTYKPIPGTDFYASECECTNEFYQEFLKDPNGQNEKYRYDSVAWNMKAYFPDLNADFTAITKVYYWHKHYKDFPVVNINHESAKAYCDWLSKKYNETPGRKYKKVEFRLPSEHDWILAATGNIPPSPEKKVFPWSGLSFKDKEGRIRANFNQAGEYNIKRNAKGEFEFNQKGFGTDFGSDGSIFTSSCKGKYQPNDFGLCHMAGNVYEFTSDPKIMKGGSFVSPGYYLLLKTNEPEFQHMESGGAFIGFRPFMYILEK